MKRANVMRQVSEISVHPSDTLQHLSDYTRYMDEGLRLMKVFISLRQKVCLSISQFISADKFNKFKMTH